MAEAMGCLIKTCFYLLLRWEELETSKKNCNYDVPWKKLLSLWAHVSCFQSWLLSMICPNSHVRINTIVIELVSYAPVALTSFWLYSLISLHEHESLFISGVKLNFLTEVARCKVWQIQSHHTYVGRAGAWPYGVHDNIVCCSYLRA
jgi:hypothetical protein